MFSVRVGLNGPPLKLGKFHMRTRENLSEAEVAGYRLRDLREIHELVSTKFYHKGM
jgi:hypothetical protein